MRLDDILVCGSSGVSLTSCFLQVVNDSLHVRWFLWWMRQHKIMMMKIASASLNMPSDRYLQCKIWILWSSVSLRLDMLVCGVFVRTWVFGHWRFRLFVGNDFQNSYQLWRVLKSFMRATLGNPNEPFCVTCFAFPAWLVSWNRILLLYKLRWWTVSNTISAFPFVHVFNLF